MATPVRPRLITTIRLAVDRGAALIDTAEMYGDGQGEELIGEALAGRREEAFLVSGVYPQNGSALRTTGTCERSLRRLKTDRIDLDLLHLLGDTELSQHRNNSATLL